MTSKKLVIDYREAALLEHLRDTYPELEFETENLPVGDIMLRVEEKPLFIIERKTVLDLVASIKDGRYRDQKHRLKQAIAPNRCLYLIEGRLPASGGDTGNGKISNLSIKSIYGSLIHTMVRDGNFVYRTDSLVETATFINDLCVRWQSLSEDWFDINDPTPSNLEPPLKIKKRGDIDVTSCFEFQLAQIPSISVNKAKIITNTYPTMRLFYDWISGLDETKRIVNLTSLSITDSKNKTKKIGKASAQKILYFLGFV